LENNKTVLILGAKSDVALAFAYKCASNKHPLILAARNLTDLQSVKADIELRMGVKVYLIEFNALAYNTHQQFYDSLPAIPNMVACFFGYLGDQQIAESNWAMAEQIINTNYTGAVSILNVVANNMRAEKRGVIIGVSSVAGERGRQSNFLYGSAKAGFTAYLSGLRNSLYHNHVHVITVLPGFIKTKMTEGLPLPMALTASPDEVANDIYKAVTKHKNVIYTKWFWQYIMLIIKNIPEAIFKKLKL
jgi:short-subunit dehydrogenase